MGIDKSLVGKLITGGRKVVCPFAEPLLFKESASIGGHQGPKTSEQKASSAASQGSATAFAHGSKEDEQPRQARDLFSKDRIKISHQVVDRVPSGLQNPSNACFCNSTLQALLSLPPLANIFRSNEHSSKCTTRECYFCHLEDTFRQMRTGQRSIMAKQILTRLRYIGKHLSPHRQADAHEFMCKLLERVELSLLEPFKSLELDYPTKCTTALHQVMGGWVQSEVKCPKCPYSSKTFGMELSAALEIPNGVDSIEKALLKYTSPEVLCTGNEWKCDGCKRKVNATKRMTFHQAPAVLSLQLKRFEYSWRGGRAKIDKRIAFKAMLDLTPYMTNASKRSPPVTYNLQAVVVHAGSAHGGHYYAYIRAANGMWYRMNDESVTQVSQESVLETNAYLLFYTVSDMKMTARDYIQNAMEARQLPSPVSSKAPSPAFTREASPELKPALAKDVIPRPLSKKERKLLRKERSEDHATNDSKSWKIASEAIASTESGMVKVKREAGSPASRIIENILDLGSSLKAGFKGMTKRKRKLEFTATPTKVADERRSSNAALGREAADQMEQASNESDAPTRYGQPALPSPPPSVSDNGNTSEDNSDAIPPAKAKPVAHAPTKLSERQQLMASAMANLPSKTERKTLLKFDADAEDRRGGALRSVLGWTDDAVKSGVAPSREDLSARYAGSYLDEQARRQADAGKRKWPSRWDQELDRGKAKKLRMQAKERDAAIRAVPGGLRDQLQAVGETLRKVPTPNDHTKAQEERNVQKRRDRRQMLADTQRRKHRRFGGFDRRR